MMQDSIDELIRSFACIIGESVDCWWIDCDQSVSPLVQFKDGSGECNCLANTVGVEIIILFSRADKTGARSDRGDQFGEVERDSIRVIPKF